MAILGWHIGQKLEFSGQNPWNWICSKIKRLASFSLKVLYIAYITNTNMNKKWNFKKIPDLDATKKFQFLLTFPIFSQNFSIGIS